MVFAPRRSWGLLLGFGLVVLLYGAFATQGALPLLSPDETAVMSMARAVGSGTRPAIIEPRAVEFSWLHPRSFVPQNGMLLPVGFPLWPVLLGVAAAISASFMLWLAVLASASALFPLVWGIERFVTWSRARTLAWALAGLLVPVAILYGNRSLFTLMPQLAGVAWVGYALLRGYVTRELLGQCHVARERRWRGVSSRTWAFGVGVFASLVIGLRPIEALWILPWWLLAMRYSWPVWRAWLRPLLLGALLGGAMVLGVHAWTYGSPFAIGYWLRTLPTPATTPVVGEVSRAWWLPLFPYGIAPRQLWTNLRLSLQMGLWPWAVLIVLAGGTYLKRWREGEVGKKLPLLAVMGWMALVLAWYYGQGQFSDHIGGLPMHLGNSFLRYLAPLWIALVLWAWYELGSWADSAQQTRHPAVSRGLLTVLLLAQVGLTASGAVWAFTDPEDGLWRGRREREHYAFVRSFVEAETPEDAIWLSDRSDKMLVPVRAATASIPPLSEVRRFLEAGQGRVWMYRRPLSQQDRDAWRQAGLEVIEHGRFPRELIYEVRLRKD